MAWGPNGPTISEVQTEGTSTDEESDDKEDDKEEEKECPECGENPCVCKNSCDKEKEYTIKVENIKANIAKLEEE